MPASPLLTQDTPNALIYKELRSRVMQGTAESSRQMIKTQVERGRQLMEATVAKMVEEARVTLEKASAVGPKLAGHVARHAESDLDLDQIESAGRTYERLVNVSRKCLGLDQAKEGSVVNVNVGVSVDADGMRRLALEPERVAELPVSCPEPSPEPPPGV